MAESPQKKPEPIRQTTPEAIRLAKTLIRAAKYGTLAVIDPRDGRPYASRVSLATDLAGMPLTLISDLSFHTKCLRADPRCSLLVGEPGKGDALAHPRISIACNAEFVEQSKAPEKRIADRFLRKNPKAKLYAGFADFNFVRLKIQSANLNGGFGQAFELSDKDLLTPRAIAVEFVESQVISELTGEHCNAARDFFERQAAQKFPKFNVIGIDSEGIDFMSASKQYRAWFSSPVTTISDLYSQMLK